MEGCREKGERRKNMGGCREEGDCTLKKREKGGKKMGGCR
jgi:hypothetical protein